MCQAFGIMELLPGSQRIDLNKGRYTVQLIESYFGVTLGTSLN